VTGFATKHRLEFIWPAIVQAIILIVFTSLIRPPSPTTRAATMAIGCLLWLTIPGCASIVSSATGGMAANLGSAILNQDDPETVRDGAPAYLIMLDSFVQGSPGDQGMLRAAAELYAAYGTVFVEDPERARRLTVKSRNYGRQALCVADKAMCTAWDLPFEEYSQVVAEVDSNSVASLFTAGLSWLAYIRAHSDNWTALAELPNAEALLLRARELDESYKPAELSHYLGIMATLRPPALGGRFEEGQAHFEQALELSGGHNLAIKVDYARYYARTLYERELHDRLLNEVLETDPVHDGLTLFNTLSREEAQALLDSGDDYF